MSAITPDNLVPAYQALAAGRGFPAGWNGGDPGRWRERGLALLRQYALPDLPDAPFAPEFGPAQDRGDHVARALTVALAPGVTAAGLLLMPRGAGPFPAVLALHDHGSEFGIGKEKCIPPLAPCPAATAWHDRFFGGQPIGPELARRGYAVLCMDALGWGARACNGYDSQQALAANLMQIGLTPAGIMAFEDMRAAAFLATLPQIDPARIAAVGFSLGGFRAWQLAALSPHVTACLASGWMAGLPGLLVPGNNQLRGQSAFWMTHPGLYRHLDLPDIAALSAPRPLLVQVGRDDALFPAAAVDTAFASLRAVWTAWGAGDRLALSRPDGGHHFAPDRQQPAFDWLDAHLRHPMASDHTGV